jgi:hypothetical protein
VVSTETVIHPENHIKGKHKSVTVHADSDQLTRHASATKVLTKDSKQEPCLSRYGMPWLLLALSSPESARSQAWPAGHLRLRNNEASSIDTIWSSGPTCRSIFPTIDDILVNTPVGLSF